MGIVNTGTEKSKQKYVHIHETVTTRRETLLVSKKRQKSPTPVSTSRAITRVTSPLRP